MWVHGSGFDIGKQLYAHFAIATRRIVPRSTLSVRSMHCTMRACSNNGEGREVENTQPRQFLSFGQVNCLQIFLSETCVLMANFLRIRINPLTSWRAVLRLFPRDGLYRPLSAPAIFGDTTRPHRRQNRVDNARRCNLTNLACLPSPTATVFAPGDIAPNIPALPSR